jgi:hypothetical protein
MDGGKQASCEGNRDGSSGHAGPVFATKIAEDLFCPARDSRLLLLSVKVSILSKE